MSQLIPAIVEESDSFPICFIWIVQHTIVMKHSVPSSASAGAVMTAPNCVTSFSFSAVSIAECHFSISFWRSSSMMGNKT